MLSSLIYSWYDFVKDYTRDPQQGKCGYRQLTKPCILNHKLFDPSNESQKEDYFKETSIIGIPAQVQETLYPQMEGSPSQVAIHLSQQLCPLAIG